MLPVSLVSSGADESVRFHVGKFGERSSEPVSMEAWDGMKVTFTLNAKEEVVQAAPPVAGLNDADRSKREKALAERAKQEILLEALSGEHVYCGKPLASAGNFAIVAKTSKGYTLSLVNEWFEFGKKGKFKPLSIDEAEAHLQELQRKSVIQAAGINRKLATDKLAAEAAVMDVKRAITNKEVEALEAQLALGAPEKGEDEDDNMDYEFECSDDDDSATVMPLLGAGDKKRKEKGDGDSEGEEEIENPLDRKILTAEDRLARRLAKLQKEHDEIEKREREEEEKAEEIGIKRERPTSAVATAEMGDAPVKKQKKVATILPITEEEIVGLLRNDPNMTLAKLIGLFKNSFGTDPDKKSKFQKIVAKVAVTKTIDGNKVLRLK